MVVDDAIVDVENVFRRLRENASSPHPRPTLQVIGRASGEVRHSILYATVLIILVFLPLLGLSGVEGKLFAPIAVATIISMVASFLVSLTLIPVLCSLLLRPRPGVAHDEGRFVRFLKTILRRTLLRVGLDYPLPVLLLVVAGVAAAFSLYSRMGKDFLPAFREETALIAVTSAPGTSLEEMNKISDVIEAQILAVPEVRKVGRRLGRAERGDHVVPVSTAEFDVDFRELVGHEGPAGRSRSEILADLQARLRTIPGVFAVVGGPLADRIGHMLSGVSAPVAIKVFGPDLDTLRRLGTEIQTLAQTIPGFADAKLDQQSSIPQLRIEADRARASAYGITPGALNDQLSTLLGGKEIAELRDGQRAVNLVLRLPQEWRDSPEKISQLPVETENGRRIPLSLVGGLVYTWLKYPFLGGVRASAQLISYELSMTMSVIPVFLWINAPGTPGTMSLTTAVEFQSLPGFWGGAWFGILMPVSAFIFLISLFAETNRQPFDMPESEADLVGGFHTEYGAFKWSLFFVAEYSHMII
eukprot:gene33775-45228_t